MTWINEGRECIFFLTGRTGYGMGTSPLKPGSNLIIIDTWIGSPFDLEVSLGDKGPWTKLHRDNNHYTYSNKQEGIYWFRANFSKNTSLDPFTPHIVKLGRLEILSEPRENGPSPVKGLICQLMCHPSKCNQVIMPFIIKQGRRETGLMNFKYWVEDNKTKINSLYTVIPDGKMIVLKTQLQGRYEQKGPPVKANERDLFTCVKNHNSAESGGGEFIIIDTDPGDGLGNGDDESVGYNDKAI